MSLCDLEKLVVQVVSWPRFRADRINRGIKTANVIMKNEESMESTPTVGTSGEYPDTILAYNHSGNVESAPVVKSESGKLPQLSRNANNPAEIIPGVSSGSVISRMIVQVLAPISLAASSKEGSNE